MDLGERVRCPLNTAPSQAGGCCSHLKECLQITGISLNACALLIWMGETLYVMSHLLCPWYMLLGSYFCLELSGAQNEGSCVTAYTSTHITRDGSRGGHPITPHCPIGTCPSSGLISLRCRGHTMSCADLHPMQSGLAQHWQLAPNEEIIFIGI